MPTGLEQLRFFSLYELFTGIVMGIIEICGLTHDGQCQLDLYAKLGTEFAWTQWRTRDLSL